MPFSEHGLIHASWRALRTPVRANWFAFGWLLVFLFALQVMTGVLLSLYYQPSPEMASESVEYIMRDVHWGWLLRGVHHWASFATLVVLWLQLLRVFLTGIYRGPLAWSWYLGLALLVTFMSFAFSGELLTADARAYWSIAAFLERVESLPVFGSSLAVLMRGGQEVGAGTLSRAYSLHVLLLPLAALLFLSLHLWLMARRRRSEG